LLQVRKDLAVPVPNQNPPPPQLPLLVPRVSLQRRMCQTSSCGFTISFSTVTANASGTISSGSGTVNAMAVGGAPTTEIPVNVLDNKLEVATTQTSSRNISLSAVLEFRNLRSKLKSPTLVSIALPSTHLLVFVTKVFNFFQFILFCTNTNNPNINSNSINLQKML